MDDARPGRTEECSAASVWRLAMASVAESLVPWDDRRVIGRGLGPLPAGSALIVERTLATDAPCVDVSLCTTRGDGGDAILAGLHHERDLPPAWLEQPVWRSIRDHYRCWTRAGSPWPEPVRSTCHEVRSTWLEFDRDQLATRCPLPSVFVEARNADAACRQPLGEAVVERFVAAAARPPVGAALQRLWPLLPAEAEPQFLGVMLPRQPEGVRVCVALPLAGLARFAARIGLPAAAQADGLIALSARRARLVVVHLDVGERLGPTLGIELKPASPEGWAPLLSDLVREGLCTAGERDALLGFPGRSGVVRGTAGPAGCAGAAIGAPDRWRDVDACVVVRTLNHVKLVCRPGRAVAAKAYLHMGPLWRSRRPAPTSRSAGAAAGRSARPR